MNCSKVLGVFSLLVLSVQCQAGGTWTKLANTPPVPIGHFLLLPDGTVMGEGNPYADGPLWYRLTPDINGNYANGTWTNMASMNFTRLDFDSLVLTNGKVLVAGGEYGNGRSTAEIYDLVSNTWTTLLIPTNVIDPNAQSPVYNGTQGFVDSACVVLADGRALIAPVFPRSNGGTVIFNPATLAWSVGPTMLGAANSQTEASWVQLPDRSILTVNFNSTTAQRFILSLNSWVADTSPPVALYSAFGGELGPAMLLPNGKAIFLGGSTNTAIYTPSGSNAPGTWAAGPVFPNGTGMPDSPAACMPNGKVLCVVGPAPTNSTVWYTPLSFYEYDYLSNSFTQVVGPQGSNTMNDVTFPCLLAALPDGSVLFGHRQKDFYVYHPDGISIAAGKPSITALTTNLDGSLHLVGRLFNGISAGASYGDDEQMDGNYPLVRFVDKWGNVRYGRTYNWSASAVMTGTNLVSTECVIPPGASPADNIQVVVNGFESGTNTIVENINDSGQGSLRQLVATLPAGSTVTFATNLSGKTILLTSGEILFTNNLSVTASNLPAGIQISGNHASRVFNIAGGVTVQLDSLTVTNGSATNGNWGGAIQNSGTLTLTRSTVTGSANDSNGGAIENGGTLTISACTLFGNTSPFAGALRNDGTCVLLNSTFFGNTSTAGNGGAIDNVGGGLTIRHCTFSGNATVGVGGAVDNYLGTVNVTNSILALNSGGTGADMYNWASSTCIFGGTNIVLSFVNGGAATGTDRNIAVNPSIATPGFYYGGPTRTMPPNLGSPAVDTGSDTAAAGIGTDQTGLPRLIGAHVDIGAVELPSDRMVTQAGDSIVGSLRYIANNVSNGVQVVFAPYLSGQSVFITNGEIAITRSLSISGAALPGGIILNGGHNNRIFNVPGGVTVTLDALTISNAFSTNGAWGGAIANAGNLTINRCTIAGNSTTGVAPGGGIYNGGTLNVNACTFSGNSADESGAIRNDGACALVNCTLTANSAYSINGGAIDNVFGSLTLRHCTIAGNSAAIYGGGVDNYQGTVFITNTIVGNNTAGVAGPDIYNWPSSTINLGTNIITALGNSGTANGTSFVIAAAPQIDALGNYGGPTKTMPPLVGSPAIDRGQDAAANGIGTDQRGFPRNAGLHVDIGAVELPVTALVVNNADSGYGSLRYVATYAPDGSIVTFAPGVTTIVVTNGQIPLLKNLTLDASAQAGGVILNGNHTNRLFEVDSGISVSLDSLTLTNGYIADGTGGGGILNLGTLNLNHCTIAGNDGTGSAGGGINNPGTLNMTACTVTGNTADESGAVDNSGSLTMLNCTLATNSAAAGNGGAIDNIFGALLVMRQCTLVGNTTVGGGGAIDNYQSTVNATNCIIAANAGDDIYNWPASTLNFGGTNLSQNVQNGGGTLNGAGTLISAAPQLSSLGFYGGRTRTMPPQVSSPAVNRGSDAAAAGVATDQRGYARPSGSHVDIGAVEVQFATQRPSIQSPAITSNGGFLFGFTNLPGGVFTVYAASNVAQALATWQSLGQVAENPVGSGQFQFTDAQATNFPLRFYQVRSP